MMKLIMKSLKLDARTLASRPRKSLGQHFLMHPRIAERIVAAAGLERGETVLEVGPGRGILTRALLARVGRVVAVETDGALVAALKDSFAPEIREGRLEIIEGDIRTYLEKPTALGK